MPCTLPATRIASLVAQGSLRPTGIGAALGERIAALDPALNAFVDFDADLLQRQAREVERRLAAGERLALAGVPVSVKDNLWVAGRPATCGSRVFADFIAPRDSWSVARLRAAGALIVGQTNCSEFACKGVTSNPLHGATRNPWDLALTPGGSSGGAAAAVAAGLGPLALATDSGGSTRRPAAHTGLVGFKPGAGRVPHPWGFADPTQILNAIGQIGRSVADVALMFHTLAGYHAGDPLGAPCPPAPDDGALRIAWTPDLGLGYPLDDAVRTRLEDCVDTLRHAGWRIEHAAPHWPEALPTTQLMVLQHAGLAELFGERARTQADLFDPAITEQIEAGRAVSGGAVVKLLLLRERIVAQVAEFFTRHDLLLCPTVPCEAWPLDQPGPARIGGRPAGPRAHAVFTPLFNHAGVPALSLPCGFGERGLPIGLQIVGPRFADTRVLAAAARIEALLGLDNRSPLLRQP
ncbi:MAG: amidase [Candidatus Dactylopiibacterium sp.]|nr:amidase [Candidatus Dactylopiibacterium sp.]